jgi:signal transduction histidine kinase
VAADAALAAALMAAAIVSSYVEFANAHPGDQSYRLRSIAAGAVAMAGPLVLRRRFALSVLVACTGGFLLSRIVLDAGDTTITSIILSLAFYSAAAHGAARWRNWVCGVSLVAVMAELWREAGIVFPPGTRFLLLAQFLALLLNFVLFCAMWALGAALGAGRRRASELLERTVELEHERGENARRAVFDERVRIARELHDVVAHHVSMMGVQAGAARVVIDRDPGKAKQALASIERSSRQGVLELHRLLGFLRQAGDPDDLAPQPGLGQLPGLAASMSESDVTVEVCVEGEERSLPPTVEVSAYRIVQEALTNTLKHSGASRADVHLRYRPDQLEVEIIDDGNGNTVPPPMSGGLGLIGMRERASLHSGQLSAGPAPGGGFVVRVELPTPDGGL